jgi:hypothetical protein
MNRFTEHSQVVTTNNCKTLTGLHNLKITVTIAHKIKSSMSVFTSLLTLNHTDDCLTSWLINCLSCANSLSASWSESESYITTEGQSASPSWKKAPVWGLRSDFYYCQLWVCWCGALSLTRGRVCRLQLLLVSPAQSLSGPSPVGLVTIFYCLRLETSLFFASYDSQG